jgi:serine protease Do
VITSFDGAEVADSDQLVRRVGDAPVGEAVRVIVLRDGKTETLSVTLGRRETAEAGSAPMDATPEAATESADILGLSVTPISPDVAEELGLSADAEGLAVAAVDEGSEAFTKGLRVGDVITEAGQQKVTRVKDLQDRVEEARDAGRKSLLLLIRRAGDPRFVALGIE